MSNYIFQQYQSFRRDHKRILFWGYISHLFLEEAQAQDKRLAQGATDAFGSVQSLLLTGFSESLETQMALEALAIGKNSKGADGQEGISAFLEKRRPHFKG